MFLRFGFILGQSGVVGMLGKFSCNFLDTSTFTLFQLDMNLLT